MEKKLIIFGTGEIAEIAFYYFSNFSEYNVSFFTVDDKFIKEENFCGKPVVPFQKIEEIYDPKSYDMHVAISYQKMNKTRAEKYNEAKLKGFQLSNFISKKSNIHENVIFGDNCFVLENQTIQQNVKLGSNIMIWSSNHIGHGTIMNNHTYLSSHVIISGHCEIGLRCFFGVNSSVADFCKIGNDCFIGMGANVSNNMSDEMSALNNSTKYFNKEEKTIQIIKKKFFKI